MHYYRYRSGSELSIKELLYNEIYFASTEECNDPFDSRTFYEFPADEIKWLNLIHQSLGFPTDKSLDHVCFAIAQFFCGLGPLSLNDILEKDLLTTSELVSNYGHEVTEMFMKRIQGLVKYYLPVTRNFACFSRSPSVSTMWSHYANNHRGFCLVFKAIDGNLYQSQQRLRRQVSRTGLKGFSPNISFGVPESFKFTDIEYIGTVEPVNAFACMSTFIYYGENAKEDEANMKSIRSEQEKHYAQKHEGWAYEMESRLMLPPPQSWLAGEHISYTNHERLFYYDPNQLVGVIFGARIDDSLRTRIIEGVKENKHFRALQHEGERNNFNFIFFDAKLSTQQREVKIEPSFMLSHPDIKAGTPDFERLYEEWKQGWGWKSTSNSSRKFHFP